MLTSDCPGTQTRHDRQDYLEFSSPGHIDQEVGGGVDGEGQVGHHGQPGYEGRRVQPAGRGTPANSIINAIIFFQMCYITYILSRLSKNKRNRCLVCSFGCCHIFILGGYYEDFSPLVLKYRRSSSQIVCLSGICPFCQALLLVGFSRLLIGH